MLLSVLFVWFFLISPDGVADGTWRSLPSREKQKDEGEGDRGQESTGASGWGFQDRRFGPHERLEYSCLIRLLRARTTLWSSTSVVLYPYMIGRPRDLWTR